MIVPQILFQTLPDFLNRDLEASEEYVQDTMKTHFEEVNALNLKTGNQNGCSTKLASIRSADTIIEHKKSFSTVSSWSLERYVLLGGPTRDCFCSGLPTTSWMITNCATRWPILIVQRVPVTMLAYCCLIRS